MYCKEGVVKGSKCNLEYVLLYKKVYRNSF